MTMKTYKILLGTYLVVESELNTQYIAVFVPLTQKHGH